MDPVFGGSRGSTGSWNRGGRVEGQGPETANRRARGRNYRRSNNSWRAPFRDFNNRPNLPINPNAFGANNSYFACPAPNFNMERVWRPPHQASSSYSNHQNGFLNVFGGIYRPENQPRPHFSNNFERNLNNAHSSAQTNFSSVHSNNVNYPKSRDRSYSNSSNQSSSTNQLYANYTTRSVENDGTQRERLTEELRRGSCDCIICFERIGQTNRTWNCSNCYQVFHLYCVRKWANSSETSEETWRCPGCQHVLSNKPSLYYCFCGKQENPEWSRHETWKIPHSCGEQCLQTKKHLDCPHPCPLLCHPGPCPPCSIYVNKSCYCGNSTKQKKCNDSESFSCGDICDAKLNCGMHKCIKKCHSDDGHICEEKYLLVCFCGKTPREFDCDKDLEKSSNFSCGDSCEKALSCGNHKCDILCHFGECPPCNRSPELVKSCPCGKTLLRNIKGSGLRKLCTDPLPLCNSVCGKEFSCGSKDAKHNCEALCHEGPCPPCSLTSFVKCSCGNRNLEILCAEISSAEAKCKKRCNKKKTCGRHRCGQQCCTDSQHKCDIICGKKLNCNLHNCDRICHLGNCFTCQNTSFNELTCHCGESVMYPPIPCGTSPPECDKPCQRVQNCEHSLRHRCHSDAECPPCTVLIAKWCYGHHELRSCIPCFQDDVCCGLACGKDLTCCRHNCVRRCHAGPCDTLCTQPCTNVRSDCGHICGLNCHEGECPSSVCKSMVNVSCRCGRRTASIFCTENLSLYSQMVDLKLNKSHDEKVQRTRTLNCDSECSLMERNRRVALALQIRNPDLTNKLRAPAYSDFLKEQGRRNMDIVSQIYQEFCTLVQNAKESKQKSRSHAFQPMKSDHRRIIHELAELFGCETLSYDQEPKKNVVATAFKDKSWLPSVSLMSVIEKESNTRAAGKAPPPVPHYSANK